MLGRQVSRWDKILFDAGGERKGTSIAFTKPCLKIVLKTFPCNFISNTQLSE